jgi:hypothetical protein
MIATRFCDNAANLLVRSLTGMATCDNLNSVGERCCFPNG